MSWSWNKPLTSKKAICNRFKEALKTAAEPIVIVPFLNIAKQNEDITTYSILIDISNDDISFQKQKLRKHSVL